MEITDPSDALYVASAIRLFTQMFPWLGGLHYADQPELLKKLDQISVRVHEPLVEIVSNSPDVQNDDSELVQLMSLMNCVTDHAFKIDAMMQHFQRLVVSQQQ